MTRRTTLILTSFLVVAGITALAMTTQSREKAVATYVGEESCLAANCHAVENTGDYHGGEAIHETMHYRIHRRPTPETVVIDRMFEKDTIIADRYSSLLVEGSDSLFFRLYKSQDRKDYMVDMWVSGGHGPSDSVKNLKIAYTYGGNGWIQRYLVEIEGRFYTLPFQYILPKYRDRSSYGGDFFFLDLNKWGATDQNGFHTFFAQNSKKLRVQAWQQNCAPCHINGYEMQKQVVPGASSGNDTLWRATWVGSGDGISVPSDSALMDQNIRIGCESCHGPGSEHSANPQANEMFSPGDLGFDSVGVERKLDVCNQCHNRFRSTDSALGFNYNAVDGTTFKPGENLMDYSLRKKNDKSDMFIGMTRWPDGITSFAHHQTGQDYARSGPHNSVTFVNGCWSCHTVHYNINYDSSFGGPLPFMLDRNWYSLKQGEGCLASGNCHATFAQVGYDPVVGDTVNLHTKHSTEVSQCVNCHFTKTASIAFKQLPDKPYYEFTDHGFRVLRPSVTSDPSMMFNTLNGMINTCAEACHRNGRGSRNYLSTGKPAAPDFGVTDGILTKWNETTDRALADSLWYHFQRMYGLVGVREGAAIGSTSALTSIAPNPLVMSSTIRYSIARAGNASLDVYDLQGRLIRTIAAGPHTTGTYAANWNGVSDLGGFADNGTYMVRLSVNGKSVSTMQITVSR